MTRVDRALGLAALLGMALPAAAQMTTCSASSATLNLGVYDSFQATPADSSAPFTVYCTREGGPANRTVTVSIGASLHSGAILTRRLKHATASDTVTYNIYRDAARSLVWGNTPATSQSFTQHIKNKTTLPYVFTLYGRIDALQDARAGAYTDSLVITVDF